MQETWQLKKIIDILRFKNAPWEIHIQDSFIKALKKSNIFKIIDSINGYPDKNSFYDIIIVVGVRAIVKQNLDGDRLKQHCKYLYNYNTNPDWNVIT